MLEFAVRHPAGGMPAPALSAEQIISTVAVRLRGVEEPHALLRAAMNALAEIGLDSLLFLRHSKRDSLVLEDIVPSPLAPFALSPASALKPPSIPLHHRLVRAFRRNQVEIAGDGEVSLLMQTLGGRLPDEQSDKRGAAFIPLHADIYQGVLVLIGSGIGPACRPAMEALSALLNGLLAGAERLEQGRQRRPQSEWLYQALAALQQAPLERRALAETALRILKEHPSGALAVLALREGDALEVYDSITQALVRLPPNQAGILGRVLSSGHALITKDAAPRSILGKLAESCPPAACAVAVPLLAGVEQSEVIGALCLAGETAGQLDEEDIPGLEVLANCLVVALGGAELLKSTQQALREQVLTWNTLVEVGRRIVRSLDSEKVARELLEVLVKLVGAEAGFRILVNDAHTHLAVVDVIGLPPEDYLSTGKPLQGTLMEWVLQHQQTLWIPDTSTAGWYTPLFSQYTRPVPRNLLMVPVLAGGKIVGALALTNKRPGTFTAQDVQVAEIMASWLSHVQENTRLYTQSRRQFERLEAALVHAGQALASGYNLRATLETIVRTAVELVGGDAGGIDLADPDNRVMRLAASHGFVHEYLLPTLPIENSLVGAVFRTGRPLTVDDMLADERVASRVLIQKLGVRSGAFVPLEDDAGRLGTLSVMRRRVEPFTAEELQVLRSFAQRAATAIRTARWREELLRQAETIEAIMQATDDLVIVLDQEGVLEYANPRARSFWSAEMADQSQASPEIRESLRRLAQRCQRALAGEMDMPFIFPWVMPDGRRFDFSVAVTSMGDRRYLITACDVTEISALERFYQALVRRMHHALRSPLSTVLATLQLLADTPQLSPEKRRQCLERALEQLQAMKAQLEQLEVYSFYLQPVAAGRPGRCDVRLALEAVLHDMQALCPDCDLQMQAGEGPLPAAVPLDLLVQLLHRMFTLVLQMAPRTRVTMHLTSAPTGICLTMHIPHLHDFSVPLIAGHVPIEEIGWEALSEEHAASLARWAEWVLIQHLVEGLGGRLELSPGDPDFTLELVLPAWQDAAGPVQPSSIPVDGAGT